MSQSDNRNREQQGADKGKNLGQGLAGINDKDRRDLMGNGDDAPTKDQRRTLGDNGADSGGGSGKGR